MATFSMIYNGIFFNENNHFKEKCKMLKNIIRHNVFENAAICDEISETQERLIITREECKFLTKKLKLFESENGIPVRVNVSPCKVKKSTAKKKGKMNGTPSIINACLNKVKKSTRKKGNINGTSSKASVNPVLNIIKKSTQKKKGNINDTTSTINTNPTIVKKSSTIKKGNNNGNSSKVNVNSTTVKKSAPVKKRNKGISAIENANPITTVKKSAPRKKGSTNGMLGTVNTSLTKGKQSTPKKKGNVNGLNKPKRPPASRKKISPQVPKPVIVGEVTIFNFGQIIYDSPSYYSDCAIYSVGYYATRTYAHFRNIYSKCTYHCKVLKGGSSPRFEIMDHDKHFKVTGLSTNECHNHLLSLINKMLVTDDLLFETDNGDRFFGLTLPLVRHRLQEKPESKLCTGYIPLKTKVDIQAEIAAENDPSMSFEGLHAWLNQYQTSH